MPDDRAMQTYVVVVVLCLAVHLLRFTRGPNVTYSVLVVCPYVAHHIMHNTLSKV